MSNPVSSKQSRALFDARLAAYVRGYIAGKLGVPPSLIESFKFRASPGRVYSEHTEDSFDFQIDVTLKDGASRFVSLGEGDTVDFLNGWTPT